MFHLKTSENGIKYFKSDVLNNIGFGHLFSTRIGGDTPVPLSSFPLGTGGFDEFLPYVEKNRQEICKILDIQHENIVLPIQKHTSIVKVVTSSDEDLDGVDGVITNVKNLPLLLCFADCTPIIMYAPEERVFGVIHAGWRGTADKICINALDVFKQKFNVSPKNINVAIGPTIGSCCYEVNDEVAEKLLNTIEYRSNDICRNNSENDKFYVDIAKINEYQLKENGVQSIDTMGLCTACNNDLFFSYRQENGVTGRHSAIAFLRD